jgi:hypothetical protein
MGERDIQEGGAPLPDLLDEYNTKKDSYLRDAFAKNRLLRNMYRNLGIAIINALASNVMSMNATQRTIIKDISLFTNLININNIEPPILQVNYQGPTTTIAGKTIPQLPMFVFTQPVVEIEQATAQVIASMFVIQIDRNANVKDPDFENTFAKYYRFEEMFVGGSGSVLFGAAIDVAPLTVSGKVPLEPTNTLNYDQRIFLGKAVKDINDNPILHINSNLYIGYVRTSLEIAGGGRTPIDLPLVVLRFESLALSPTYRDYFKGIRIMNTLCRGRATSPIRYVGQITIIRQAGYAGTIFCTEVS